MWPMPVEIHLITFPHSCKIPEPLPEKHLGGSAYGHTAVFASAGQ